MRNNKKFVLAALAGAILLGGTLSADPAFARRGWQDPQEGAHHQEPWRDHGPDWNHDNDYGQNRGNGRGHDNDRDNNWRNGYRFETNERVVVRNYYTNYYSNRHRPTRVRYVVGRPLERTVVYRSVPQPVLVDLRPAPRGYHYVEVDGDVLLMQDLTRLITDAITLR